MADNRRVRMTKKLIKDAYLELLESNPSEKISVTDVCKVADVNRSTFYLHYETIGDLLAESSQYIIDQFVRAMPDDTEEFMTKLRTRPLEELYLITPEYLVPYLNYIKEHKRIFRTANEHATVLGMNDAYLALNRHVFMPILDRFQVPQSEQKYLMPFYINGLIGIINEWLKDDCRDSVEQVIAVIQNCIAKPR